MVEVTKVIEQKLPRLGVGLGYRQAFRSTLWEHRDSIDFFEVIADHFFDATIEQQQELDLLKRHFQLVPHGLALSLGSAEGVDRDYLQRFASLVDRIAPPWCSDHIAFTRANGIDIGHLVPLPKTRATLRVLRDNLQLVQDRIQVPLILENITESLRYPEDEYDDAEFLAEICEQNDVERFASGCYQPLHQLSQLSLRSTESFTPIATQAHHPVALRWRTCGEWSLGRLSWPGNSR
ncbi:MAG: DUF692 family protein [Pirellulales bacterium]